VKKSVLVIVFISCIAASGFAGRDCEVVGFSLYESLGIEIVERLPVQVLEKCAVITIRNTADRKRFVTDYSLKAVFEDGETRTKHIDGEQDRLKEIEPGQEYRTSKCFGGSRSRIAKVDCGY
jgi:hypothetical protein